ncbi:MAG: hypothetical protein KJ574_00365 [Nanoarchaeota archaeon]|nr:hypothetical protein [Nanoarchaeota archaeon]
MRPKQKYTSCILLLLVVIAAFFISGCRPTEPAMPEVQETMEDTEYIGGKYNLTLIATDVTVGNKTYSIKKIKYTKEGLVIDPDQILPDSMRPGLDWLKENTPGDAIIMSWWDYGHMIRAYAEREPVIDAPSKDILTTTVAKYLGKSPDEIDCPDCVQDSIIQDVANLLVSEDPDETARLMKKYSASFLYISAEDVSKVPALYIALSQEPRPVSSTTIGKALAGEPLEGFELVYHDSIAMIYGFK